MNPNTTGLILASIGSTISVIGVIENNLILNHIAAMQVWWFSNLILCVYFFGRWRKLWDGGISDALMFGLYVFYVATNEWGLRHL